MLSRLKFTTLQWTLGVSVLLHVALLFVRFVDPQAIQRAFEDTPLDVILVNAKSQETPQKAQALAQQQLAGGGEAAQGRATSPLPPALIEQRGDHLQDQTKHIDDLQAQQAESLLQVVQERARLNQRIQQLVQRPLDPVARSEIDALRLILNQLAEIEARIEEQNQRPRKKFISPATREVTYALYYDALRRKVEARGTQHFPAHQGQKIYGELTMNIVVDAAGQVVDTEVLLPSPLAPLNRQAQAIVRASAPFGPFTPAMRQEADQMVVTARFRFTREAGLTTQLSSSESP